MGRWDALKPSQEEEEEEKEETRTRSSSKNTTNAYHYQRKKKSSEDRSPRRRGDANKRFNNTTAAKQQDDVTFDDNLIREYVKEPSCDNLELLSRAVKNAASQIPSETASTVIIHNIFLPFLQKVYTATPPLPLPRKEEEEEEEINVTACAMRVLEALQALLQETRHTAGIMAPLVQEIGVDGKETLLGNPVRLTLFRVLTIGITSFGRKHNGRRMSIGHNRHSFLPKDQVVMIITSTVSCLQAALKSAMRVDGIRKHATSNKLDLEPSVAYKLFTSCRYIHRDHNDNAASSSSTVVHDNNKKIQWLALELMISILKRHPETTSSFCTLLFLVDHTQQCIPPEQPLTCRICGYSAQGGGEEASSTHFLDYLHDDNAFHISARMGGNDVDGRISLVLGVMNHAPLQAWIQPTTASSSLGQDRSGYPSFRYNMTSKGWTWGFRERLLLGLGNLLRIARCKLCQRPGRGQGSVILQGAKLAGCLFRRIPYTANGNTSDQAVLRAGCALVQATVDVLLQTGTSSEARNAAVQGLLQGMGGHVTPQGELTTMCLPIKQWLTHDNGGKIFVGEMLKSLGQLGVSDSNHDNFAKILRAVMRCYPDSILDNPDCWKQTLSYLRSCCESSVARQRVQGAQLLEALLRGRRDFGTPPSIAGTGPLPFMQLTEPLLRDVMVPPADQNKSAPLSVLRPLLSGYSALLSADWDDLSKAPCFSDRCHIDLLLNLINDVHLGKNVKADACKTVGDVCMNYFSALEENQGRIRRWQQKETHELCNRICDTLLQALADHDGKGAVASSSVFALGNLAQSLRPPSVPMLLSFSNLKSMSSSVLALINHSPGRGDEDPKISSNAMRSVAHISCLLFREDYREMMSDPKHEEGHDRFHFLKQVVQSLTAKVQASVELVTDVSPASLSWKQRSMIRKQGWGACNSLSIVFVGPGLISLDSLEDQPELLSALEESLSWLLLCVEKMDDTHEKIVVSSMASLHSMQAATLFDLTSSGRRRSLQQQNLSLSLAPATLACITCLGGNREDTGMPVTDPSPRLVHEATILLKHLLICCSIADAAEVLVACTPAQLNWLCTWMIDRACPACTFDAFVLAMQRPGINVDVRTEQRFTRGAIRTLPLDDAQVDEL